MHRHRGQATVEWTAAALLVTILLAAAAAGAERLGGAGLPQRLLCALAGGRCGPQPALARLGHGPPVVFYARAPLQHANPLAAAVALAPGPRALEPVVGFVRRHEKMIRQVVLATAIGVGVAATCAGSVVAANAIGGALCGSSIVTGGYAAYRNATS